MRLTEADAVPREADRRTDAQPAAPTVTVDRVVVMRWTIVVGAVIGLASIATTLVRVYAEHGQLGGLTSLFDVNVDAALPSVFAAALMLGAAAVCWAGAREDAAGIQGIRRHWRFLALAFAILAVDELAGMHVIAEWVLAAAFGPARALALSSGILMAVLAGLLLLAYRPFLQRLPRRTAVGFVIAGAVYVFAAVGLDAASAWLVDSPAGSESPGYAIASLCEEILEVVGLLLFLNTGLGHLERAEGGLRIGIVFRS